MWYYLQSGYARKGITYAPIYWSFKLHVIDMDFQQYMVVNWKGLSTSALIAQSDTWKCPLQ